MSTTRGKTLPGRKRWPIVVLSILCILLVVLAVFAVNPSLLQNIVVSTSGTSPAKTQTGTISTTSPTYQAEAQAVAQQYMTALLKQDYSAMWSLLHPQIRSMWSNERAFARFWQARFRDFRLQNFTIGNVRSLPEWVNPDTMLVYGQVAEMPVSLQLQPSSTLQQQSQVPPEDLHPGQVLRNLPFVVQKIPGTNGGTAQWFVLDGGPADLEAPILPPMNPPEKAVQVPILMYHHISDVPTRTVLALSLTVTPTRFSQHLDYLKQRGYHTITFNQLFNALYFGGPLPQQPIILTFDDGYDDAYKFAFPILKAHGFSGMFYIITGKVGWGGQATWPQLRTMLASGMQIGSHTINHVDMGRLLAAAPGETQKELQQSQAALQKNLGVAIQQFCYPSGEPFRHGTLAEQQQIVALLAADGYVGATTDPGQTGIDQNSQAPFVLLRLRVDGRESLQGFEHSMPW